LQEIQTRILERSEYTKAMDLAWTVYREFEAPDYEQDGIEAYYASIHSEDYLSQICLYGAFDGEDLVGVLATRYSGTHITMFCVDGEYHRRGIGKRLFLEALRQCPKRHITVRSSPYAVPVYRRLGFHSVGSERSEGGTRFTPMRCRVRPALRRHGGWKQSMLCLLKSE